MVPAREENHACAQPNHISFDNEMRVWKNRGMMIKWGCKPVRAKKRLLLAASIPGGWWTEKTRSGLLQKGTREALCSLDHSCGLPLSPFCFQCQVQGWKEAWSLSMKAQHVFLETGVSNNFLILWLEYILFPVGSLRALGPFKNSYSKCWWTQLKLVPPVCPVL